METVPSFGTANQTEVYCCVIHTINLLDLVKAIDMLVDVWCLHDMKMWQALEASFLWRVLRSSSTKEPPWVRPQNFLATAPGPFRA